MTLPDDAKAAVNQVLIDYYKAFNTLERAGVVYLLQRQGPGGSSQRS